MRVGAARARLACPLLSGQRRHRSHARSEGGARPMDMRNNAVLIEERTSTPLEPDTLVPAQYFDRIGTDIAFQPEKRLMLAVLEEAIATFQRHVGSTTPRSTRLVQDVEDWTNARDQDWPFSFENICAGLNLESEYVRTGMVR